MPVAYCPMCHQGNKDTAKHCRRCDYEFGQPIEKVRGMLEVQLRGARIQFWIALALMIGAIAGIVVAVTHGLVLVGSALLLPVWWIVRSRQTISISKKSLASLARQQPQLPMATLLEK